MRRLTRTPLALALVAASSLVAFRPTVAQTAADRFPAGPPGTGRIVGYVLDAAQGTPVPLAMIEVVGAPVAARSGVDGRYTLERVPSGAVSILVRRIGYRPKTVTGVMVPGDGVAALDVLLQGEVFELHGVTVTAAEERGSVAYALDGQRASNRIVNAVSAEQIRRSPDSDAGQAVQRVSGVTVQDGRYVFVRGLGERYTTTALNGARIPSPEPERKIVPFDVFPSGLLDEIVTAKTYTPDQPGDFSGAHVNIKTRDFITDRTWSVSTSVGFNAAAAGRAVARAPRLRSDWLGFAGEARRMPALVAGAGTLTGKSQAEVNEIAASFRNAWSVHTADGTPNGGLSASLGGEDPIFGRPVTYVASFTYGYGQEIRRDERRAMTRISPSGGTEIRNASRGSTGRARVLWGGVLNVGTRLGETGRLALNNTVTQSGENEATRLAGLNDDLPAVLELTRLTFTERRVRSHQLLGQHLVRGRDQLDWSVAASAVRRLEPDRTDLAYQTVIDSLTGESRPYAWYGAPRSAAKTYSDIAEGSWEAGTNYRLALGEGPSALKAGLLLKATDREADTRSYDLSTTTLTDREKRQPAEAIFNGTYAREGRLILSASAALGTYTAADRVIAGYLLGEIDLSPRVRLVGGARLERSHLEVTTRSLGLADTTAVLRNTDVLPSLALQFRLGAAHNLRFSASQTLSRPEYRELSPAPYFNILGYETLRGNPGLRRALIQNADARWEWYPTPGQVASVGVFAKRFHRPLERILVQRSSDVVEATFVNADRATNYGVELELRGSLVALAPALLPFTLSANVTLMRSEIEPGNDSLSSLTNARRPMVGQAAFVANAGLTYASASGRGSATVLYNVVGRRISEAGIAPFPDVYEEARHQLDVSAQLPLGPAAVIKLDAKNLLDCPHRFTQGSVERLSYRTGRVFASGVTWTP